MIHLQHSNRDSSGAARSTGFCWQNVKIIRVILGLIFLGGTMALYWVLPFIHGGDPLLNWFATMVVYPQAIPSVFAFKTWISAPATGWMFWAATGFFLVFLMTLLFGRLYCSSLCPLGVWFDFISWGRKRIVRNRALHFTNSQSWIGYLIVGATLLIALVGSLILVSMLDPFGITGRAIGDAGGAPLPATLFSLLVFIGISLLAWAKERWYCTTICPVGIILGLLSRVSLFRIAINPESCTQCGNCEQTCKSHCIDYEQYKIDFERCVGCLNCLTVCEDHAMNWKNNWWKTRLVSPQITDPTDEISKPFKPLLENQFHHYTRRRFLGTMAILSASTTLTGLIPYKVVMASSNTESQNKFFPVLPPGSPNSETFSNRCISCHLCVAICPTGVLVPAFWDTATKGWMQPHMDFSRGFCEDSCSACLGICPTNAIQPLSLKEKQNIQIGIAVLIKNLCLPVADRKACGECATVCPTSAIKLNPYLGNLTLPEIIENQCTGCGACVYICPVRPERALYVEPLSEQGTLIRKHTNFRSL